MIFAYVRRSLLPFALILLIVVTAMAFRVPHLADRPMHADEAVQAAIFRTLWLTGSYRYDPDEFHGPTLSYFTLPSVWVERPVSFTKCTKATFRIVPVIFSAGLILIIFWLSWATGRMAAVCAAVLFAISPAMVFFNRYYIHETLLVFFTLAAIAAGWRYARTGRFAWCLAAGTCIGLMQATKETSVLVFFCMACATILTAVWSRLTGERIGLRHPATWRRQIFFGLIAAIFVAGLFLSSFLANPRGPMDGLLTYLPWLKRAGGQSPHIHPWYFYIRILCWWQEGEGPVWTELATVLLAAVGFVTCLLPSKGWLAKRLPKHLLNDADIPFIRWLGFFTVLLLATYSVIPYKTPWCILSPLSTLFILAGIGVAVLLRMATAWPIKGVAAILLMALVGQLGWQSYRANFVSFADPTSPYVYAHTAADIERLGDDVQQLSQASPDGDQMLLKVVWQDNHYWPIPWYLRQFDHIGYWTHVPEDAAAPIVIASPCFDVPLTKQLDETHLMTGYYEIRPNILAQLWVSMELWEAHLRRLGRITNDK